MGTETVGGASLRLSQVNDKVSAIDQMRESLTDYDKNVHECVDSHKKSFDGDFYVVVLTKKEKLMRNVLRGYFFARLSCPTPTYDQAVYRYIRKDDNLEFLWVIPSADNILLMKDAALDMPTEGRELFKYVLDFSDGTLDRLAKKLNGEELGSIFLEKGR